MLWPEIMGQVELSLLCANIPALLLDITNSGIEIKKIIQRDELTVIFTVVGVDLRRVEIIANRHSAKLFIIKKTGLLYKTASARKRPVLISGILLILFLSIYIPSRIFFVNVSGNVKIPTAAILCAAENCGIRFGASRKDVRSEKVKNNLLSLIPELQWAGINTAGCVATISVKERSVQETSDTSGGVSSIIAARDGIIRSCDVKKGSKLCKIGQAVKAGQTLVSGYTDCGIYIQGTQAEAEIFAQTNRKLTVMTPTFLTVRGDLTQTKTRFTLRIGKKLIKLYKDSGISDATCVKMYFEQVLSLPGGFTLPVALIRETQTSYVPGSYVRADTDAFSWMEDYSQDYLSGQMIAGKILSCESNLAVEGGICTLSGNYFCLEMIGKVHNEEILGKYGQAD